MGNIFRMVSAAILLVIAGCGDSPPLERITARQQATLSGSFLTESADQIVFPVKILFAIDCSGSMGAAPGIGGGAGSDPSGLRLAATQAFIDQYNNLENVSFEIMLWHGSVFARTRNQNGFGFTKDPVEINSVLQQADNNSYTDYVGTINTMRDDILRDISLNDDRDSRMRTKYIVIFFSDGLDDVGEPVRETAIMEAMQSLYDMVNAEGVGSFNFHTFFLSALFQGPGYEVPRAEAYRILCEMAQIGNGQCREFESAQAIDFIQLVDMRLTAEYMVKYLVAYNYNALPGVDNIYHDSDGDGLPDEHETTYGCDPQNWDSDGDGMSDFFEVESSPTGNELDPLVWDSNCPLPPDGTWRDFDRDGLTDCEESIKGTDYRHPDTDRDGIPDGIEFRVGMNPFEAQVTNDTDFDGSVDWLEAQRHTNVTTNDPLVRERYGYSYDLRDMGMDPILVDDTVTSYVRQYDFTISNISIMQTEGSLYLNPGDNLIRLFIAQVPEDMPDSPPIFRMAEVLINSEDNTRSILLDTYDFELIQ